MTAPLTWDRWKQLLLPRGWEEDECTLMSPLSPVGLQLSLVNGDLGMDLFLWNDDGCIDLNMIPSTMYQMMSLLHGLKIPLGSSPIHPPNPHSGKPVEQTEQVSNQADTRT